MLPSRLLTRLFRRAAPRAAVATVSGIGRLTRPRDGPWVADDGILLDGRMVGVSISCSGRLPDNHDAERIANIRANWTDLWSGIVNRMRLGLSDDGPSGERTAFFAAAHPVGIDLAQEDDRWQVWLAPDLYGGHLVVADMVGSRCVGETLNG